MSQRRDLVGRGFAGGGGGGGVMTSSLGLRHGEFAGGSVDIGRKSLKPVFRVWIDLIQMFVELRISTSLSSA